MSKVIDKIKQNMQERKEKKEKKELIEKLKYMNDDELEEFVIKQIQKGNSQSKKAAVTAIQTIGEPEKQLEITSQISDELTKKDRTQIIKSIDEATALLDDNGIDIIKALDKRQKIEIVERILTNQRAKIGKMSLAEISENLDKMYCLVNESNDFSLMKVIEKVQDKLEEIKLQEEVSSSAKKRAKEIKIKVVKIAAKKVVSNYKNIGYCMRITEFMNSAIPIKMGPDAELNRQKYTKQKEFFLDMVGYEGRKLRMKNARSTIAELLQKEEERHKQGEIKKIERDAGKGVVEKITKLHSDNSDASR